MNDERKKRVTEAIVKIEDGLSILNQTKDEEQDAFDEMSEKAQESEKGEKAQEDIASIESAVDHLESAISDLDFA